MMSEQVYYTFLFIIVTLRVCVVIKLSQLSLRVRREREGKKREANECRLWYITDASGIRMTRKCITF